MTAPVVSIGIAAYRRPAELREAMASVLSQELDDLELIVGDDTGELEDVAASFDDERVRYIAHPQRLGITGNYNALLDEARGRYIGLLNDDDFLLPGYLSNIVPQLDADASVGIAFTNHHYLDAAGRRTERACSLPPGRHADFVYLLMKHAPVANSASLMRREVWSQVRPLPDLHTSDRVLQIRAALAGWAFYYVDRPLAVYRVHEGQASFDELPFRNDNVALWDAFAFDDAPAELLRREYLSRSLIARAASHLKRGAYTAAAADAKRAQLVAPGRLRARERAISQLAAHPTTARAAVALWRLTRRRKTP